MVSPTVNTGYKEDDTKTKIGKCGGQKPDMATDNDGTPECNDSCPMNARKTEPVWNGRLYRWMFRRHVHDRTRKMRLWYGRFGWDGAQGCIDARWI